LNGDGKLDVVVANFGPCCFTSSVSVLLGNGDGTLGARTDFATDNGSWSVAVGDLNGDGKLDLATANSFFPSNSVSVLLGNGDGSFGATTNSATGSNAKSVAIGDLNGDGKLDLATANSSPGTVSVLLGNGDGSFATHTDYVTGTDSRSVAIGDLNGDGKPDLAVANAGSFPDYLGTISVLLGNGDGSFGAKTDHGTGNAPYSVAIRDLDGDGNLDLAAANQYGTFPENDGSVSVLLGDGSGGFAPKTDYVTATGPVSLAIGDVNGDGKPDLATANPGSHTASVLLNIGVTICAPTPVSFDLSPSILNLRSLGRWVTATLEPEPPAAPEDIDVASILLGGSVPVDPSAPASIGDVDHDGRPDLTVKFGRAAVQLILGTGNAVPVTVTGEIGGGCFEATDFVRVIRARVTAPSAGSVLQGGNTAEVRWETPAEIDVRSVSLLGSTDDGASWTLVAADLPNDGSYGWTVPTVVTDQARVAVVLVESAAPTGFEVNGVLGVSDRFAISTSLGVGSVSASLALHGSAPNPGRDPSVIFTLPDARPASLVVYDVSGREVSRRAVGALGAGRHAIPLRGSATLAPGLYVVHLVREGKKLVARAVVVP
jgi:hypothetical protein